ncbi:MAG: hypothetical protein CM15mV47_220 [uncultured marine virus]|nr:MAG: hypothetical protein CM15mV47_220 [uncultured marine virus]
MSTDISIVPRTRTSKKQSPKVEQYLLKRLEGVKAGFPLQGL